MEISNAGTDNRLILFDCDGTLTDSHGAIVSAMQQAFAAQGLTPPEAEAVNAIIGLSLTKAVEALLPPGIEATMGELVMQGYRDSYRLAEQHISLYPDVHVVLKELKRRGYWLGVVTGKSHAGLLRVLEMFDLGHYFYVLRTADCTHSKPHPAMVDECMVEMGVGPAQTTVIGDAIFDMQMAMAAKVTAIGVSFGVGDEVELDAAGAETVVHSFSALLDHFPPLACMS